MSGENQVGILSWIVVGGIAGWLSGQVMRAGGFGLLGDILVGVAGGLLGGWVGGIFFDLPNTMNGITVASILVAFLGAVVLIAVARMFQGRNRGSLLPR
jgi:uncharacterized membrane protein YeaQ/YmgE (transglycosylase-associated protein family)